MAMVPSPEDAKAFIEKPLAFVERIGLQALIMEPDTHGKAAFILKTAVRDADDRVVAKTEGVYQLRKTGS